MCNVLVIVTAFFTFSLPFSSLSLSLSLSLSVSSVRVVIASLSLFPSLRSTIEAELPVIRLPCDNTSLLIAGCTRDQVTGVHKCTFTPTNHSSLFYWSLLSFSCALSVTIIPSRVCVCLRVSVCLHINPNKHPVRRRRRRPWRERQLHSLMTRWSLCFPLASEETRFRVNGFATRASSGASVYTLLASCVFFLSLSPFTSPQLSQITSG